MSRNHHFISKCKYHIVICPKFKKEIMTNDIKIFLDKKIHEICLKYKYILMDISIEPDHVHLCLELDPTYSIGSVIRNLKSITGYYIFREFKSLRSKYFWNSGFWSNGYFVSTIGDVSTESVLNYIKNQENYNN